MGLVLLLGPGAVSEAEAPLSARDSVLDLEARADAGPPRVFADGTVVPEPVRLDDETTWSQLTVEQKDELRAMRARDVSRATSVPPGAESRAVLATRNEMLTRWAGKHERLRRATIGTGLAAALVVFGALVATAVVFSDLPGECGDDVGPCPCVGTGCITGEVTVIAGATWGVAAAFVATTTGVGIAYSLHGSRKPRVSLGPAGIGLRF